MKRTRFIIIVAAIIILIGGGGFFGYYFINSKFIKPLKNAEDLNAVYLSTYGDVGNVVVGWTAIGDMKYGKEITDEDLLAVALPESTIAGGVVSDLSALLGKYCRVDITPGALLTQSMIMDFPIMSDERAFDVITAFNPIGLQPGDLVDIRVILPTGEDYVALSRKRVEGVYNDVLKLIMSEYDIMVYNSLIVDTSLFKGTIIYSTKYLNGTQTAAEEFYPISANILRIALSDPNITDRIDYQTILSRRVELEDAVSSLNNNDILRDMLQAGKNAIPGKIQSGHAAWQTQQDLERAQRLEQQLYGGSQ